jgi:hypothetical protein
MKIFIVSSKMPKVDTHFHPEHSFTSWAKAEAYVNDRQSLDPEIFYTVTATELD